MSRRTPAPAKLSLPRLYEFVRRPSLFSLLDGAKQHPAVWVAGPPGCGKTTLLASWAREKQPKAVWYRMDAGDADVSSLFALLGEVLRRRFPRRRRLPYFTPEHAGAMEAFARRFFRRMFEPLGEGAIVVFDNWSESDSSSDLRKVMRVLIEEVPESALVVFASRDRPFPELAGHVARQDLASIGWEELRFSRDETALALGAAGAAAVELVHGQTGGWAAGVVLMREHLRREGWERGAVDVAGSRELFDYFAAEALTVMTEQDRDDLMRIAILPVINAHVAKALTDGRDTTALLERLYRGNLFVQKHALPEPSYRLHALFREFLLERERLVTSEEDRKKLRATAGDLLERHGWSDLAYELHIASGATERALRLVVEQSPDMLRTGRWKTLLDRTALLPVEARQNSAWLGYWVGLAEFQFDQTRSRLTLDGAWEGFVRSGDVLGQTLTAAAILAGFYFEYVDWTPADIWIERLASLLDSDLVLPDLGMELTVRSALLYGIAIRQPEHPMLQGSIERVMSLLDQPCDVNARMQAGLAITGPVACMLGAFELFRRVREQLTPLLRDSGVSDLNRACWHMTCGSKMSFDGDCDEAFRELAEGARLSAESGFMQIEFLSHHMEGLHAACYFEAERATAAFERSRALVDWNNPLQLTYVRWGQQAEASLREDADGALRYAREAKRVGDGIGSAAHRLIGSVFLATALVRCGQYEEASQVVDEAGVVARKHRVPTWDVALEAIVAWSHLCRGQLTLAREGISSALRAGRDGRTSYLRWIFDGARDILEFALREQVEVDQVRALLRRFRYEPRDLALESWPWPVRIYTLDRFIVEVDGQPLQFSRKVPKKPLGLLQCVIARGGHSVPDHVVMDDLWPDADGDEAHRRLALALHRLRGLLGDSDAISLKGGKLTLCRTRVWVDVLAFLETPPGEGGHRPHLGNRPISGQRFLAGESPEPWMAPMRKALDRLPVSDPPVHRHESAIGNQ